MSESETKSALVEQIREVLELYGITLKPEMLKEKGDIDYKAVLTKTQDKIEELNRQAEEVARNIGMSREELEAYAQNPDNFTPEQWESLERVRQECANLKEKAAKALSHIAAPPIAPKPAKAEKKKTKQKFGKKKKWLQL